MNIKVGKKSSGWVEVLNGVPQGLVLGTLSFLIFVNELLKDSLAVKTDSRKTKTKTKSRVYKTKTTTNQLWLETKTKTI
jgi:hypothetical protein